MASPFSSRLWKYDVFLSFRGVDTRKSFVSHLYAELIRKSLIPFKDDLKLQKGKPISPEILNAIEDSRFAIVVISENYASSCWCLDELVKIVNRWEKGFLAVVPIFYEIDPSHVRKQIGSFEEAFKRHEEKLKENPEKVQTWKDALRKVASIAGEDSRNWMEDSKLIEKIVRDISNNLISGLPRDSDDLVGMEGHKAAIDSILSIGSIEQPNDRARMIGIWGMGGVGKTTLAMYLRDKYWNRFQSTCYIEDVKKKSSENGLLHLQNQLLSEILHEKDLSLSSLGLGSSAIKARLAHKRVLVILDDVDHLDQLNALARSSEWFGLGSRIIITTRDKHLLSSHGVKLIYEVKCLSFDDAAQLFSQFAFKTGRPCDLSRLNFSRVVKSAGGLPLALKVLGSMLCDRSEVEWENVMRRLEKTPPRDIFNVSRISYDRLGDEDKSVFLCIACFFRGEKVDYVRKFLDISGYSVPIAIKILTESSLIHLNNDGCIQMHDTVEQMGKQIVREESIYEPGRRKFLWNPTEICEVLAENTGTEAIEGIILNTSKITELSIGQKAFKGMRNLKFLKIYKQTCGREIQVNVPASTKYSRCKLRLLHWDAYPLKTLCFSPDYLVEVSLRGSNLGKLWEGNPLLRNLRKMDLRGSENLIEIADLSKASNLEVLNLEGCSKLESLTSNMFLECLQVLNLEGCSSLGSFPSISRNIEQLILQGTDITEVPESIGHLSDLIFLEMWDCKKLTKIHSQIGKLTALQALRLSDCTMLQQIPRTFQKLTSLETLVLFGCQKVTEFPLLHENIRHLYLTETAILEVPVWIENLSRLQTLDISGNKRLKSLPSSMSKLKCLEVLDLEGCTSLETFPHEICETASPLKELYLDGTGLKALPKNIGNLKRLREFSAMKMALEQVPFSITQTSNLTDLRLGRGCYISDSVPIQCPLLSNLCGLRCLSLINLNMQEIPYDLGELFYLEMLDLSGNDFEMVPSSIKQLLRLKRLIIHRCAKLQSLPALPHKKLEYLSLHDCASLETTSSLFRHSLACLVLSNCFRLDQDAQLLIQHIASASSMQVERRIACLPGSSIPGCFNYQANGSSLTIPLSQSQYLSRFERFAACIIVAIDGRYNINDLTVGYNFLLRDKYGEQVRAASQLVHLGFVGEKMEVGSDHLFLFSVSIGTYHEDASDVSFEFYLKDSEKRSSSNWEVKQCGVRQTSRISLDSDALRLDFLDQRHKRKTPDDSAENHRISVPSDQTSSLDFDIQVPVEQARGTNAANKRFRWVHELL